MKIPVLGVFFFEFFDASSEDRLHSSLLSQFVQTDKRIGINIFPAQYRIARSPLQATDAYALRQIQLALKLTF